MSDTSVLAILASVGIFLAGTVTADAAALASAIQQGDPSALEDFVVQYPDSSLAPDALWLAAEVTNDKLTDSQVSSGNPELACTLTIRKLDNGTAEVSWTMSGAKTATLTPLGFKKGQPVPKKGTKTIPHGKYLRVGLIAEDGNGNKVECSVVLSSRNVVTHGTTGTTGGGSVPSVPV